MNNNIKCQNQALILDTRAPSCKLHGKCILHALSHQRCLRLFRVCPSLLAYEKSSSPREHTAVQPQQHPGNLCDNPVRLLRPRRIFLLFLATSHGIQRVWKSTRKINPKSIQNYARKVPGGHPGPPWGLPESKINPKSTQNDAREVPGEHPGPPWGLPEVGLGRFSDATENIQKIESFWEAPRNI